MVENQTSDIITADEKLHAEVARLLSRSSRVGVLTFLVPGLAAAGLMGATAALMKLIL